MMKAILRYLFLAFLLFPSCAKDGGEARFVFHLTETEGWTVSWSDIEEIQIDIDLFYSKTAWVKVEGGRGAYYGPIYKESGRLIREAGGWSLYKDTDSGAKKVEYLAVFAPGEGHRIGVDMFYGNARLYLEYPAVPGEVVVDPGLTLQDLYAHQPWFTDKNGRFTDNI